MQQEPSFVRGAIDLSASRSTAPAATTAGGGSWVIDVTEENFQAEVIERSLTVPVVLDLWADWCQPCKQLSPILERLADSAGGRWVLAKIDVDANQRIAAAFGVQGIPAVFAVIKGQPLPLFTGALPEVNVRQFIDELLRVAAENGVAGTVPPVGGAAQPEPANGAAAGPDPAAAGAAAGPDAAAAGAAEESGGDPELDAATAAVDAGDLDGAIAAYEKVLAGRPDHAEARTGLAAVKLVKRTEGLDPGSVRRGADEQPDGVAAQVQAADVEMINGQVDEAFDRLIELVRRTTGDDRNQARTHLLELFEVASDDPRVAKARTKLANALF
ncbi:MAG: tetratricopeptide repeat protein [Sporichthyaceae bacterium]|nr:tetratricopeptide repeat protein [Sporichthyaceae bacterium]